MKGPIALDVSDAVPLEGEHRLRGFVSAPQNPPRSSEPTVVFCCLPGGSCTTAYFDLEVAGLDGYSMADYLAGQGFVVLAIDHLGVGASSPVEDLCAVTPAIAAAANHGAFSQALAQLHAGSLLPGLGPVPSVFAIGLGHSMGGMLTMVQQANHHTYQAVVNLGHGGDGLPRVLTDEERSVVGDPDAFDASIVALARARYSRPRQPPPPGAVPGTFHADDVPDVVRKAFVAQTTELLHACGLTSMIPGSTDREKGRIDVPVYLTFGDHDLTTRPHEAVAAYRGSRDLTLFVMPHAGHCHNQAGNRVDLWDRIADWARRLRFSA